VIAICFAASLFHKAGIGAKISIALVRALSMALWLEDMLAFVVFEV
jgi:hypothetical protein